MKRFISFFYLFIMCCMYVVPSNSGVIYAVEDTALESYVYYQALVARNGDYRAISAVSQYYYTNTSHLGETQTKNKDGSDTAIPITARNSGFSNLYGYSGDGKTEQLCSVFSDKASSMLCGSNGLLPVLASLRMNAYGDMTLELSNGVELQNLNIYYILANKVGTENLYCSNTAICENSRYVIGANGTGVSNWTNRTQDATNMQFTRSSIVNKFNLNELATGEKIYSGYNVYNDILQTVAQLAEASGIYVVTNLSVEYNNVTYYINRYTVSSRQFADSVDNASSAEKKEAVIASRPYLRDDNVGGTISNIADYAALIKPKTTRSINDNRGFGIMEGFFEETLRPILIIAIGVLFVIVGTHTGVTIVKSSDEPEVRAAAVKKFIGLFVGAFAISMILIFYKDIISAIQRYF